MNRTFNDGHAPVRHPRTVLGINDVGQMFVVVFEGRRADAKGATYLEGAQLLHELGATEGVQLDGGGSSTLVVKGQRANDLPTGQGGERGVSHAVAIVRR